LIDGKVSKTVTVTKRISSTVIEKTKGHAAREGKESQDKPLMTNKLSIIAKEDEDLGALSSRGLGVIKTCRTKKSTGFFFSDSYACG
jgi:hypothetical protein